MMYFKDCKTLEDVKREYKKLVKALHPDNGGDAESFKEMSAQYIEAFNRLKNIHVNQAGETYEKETTETPEEYADIINRVIHFDGVIIEIIGSWVWLSGNTFPYKEEIKAAGFFYSKSKKSWYYNGDEQKSRRRGRFNMEQLRSRWGCTEIQTEKQAVIA